MESEPLNGIEKELFFMNCPNCESGMGYGAPHCETIKTQLECVSCGHIEPEYYTPEEQKVNRLITSTSAGFYEIRAALESSNGDEVRARRLIRETYLNRLCRELGTTGEAFAKSQCEKELAQVTDAGLMFLTLTAQKQLGRRNFFENNESK